MASRRAVLRIMAQGFDPALGVSCSHCHVVGEYEKEDKPIKQIARDMFAMVTAMNWVQFELSGIASSVIPPQGKPIPANVVEIDKATRSF